MSVCMTHRIIFETINVFSGYFSVPKSAQTVSFIKFQSVNCIVLVHLPLFSFGSKPK